MAVHLQLASTLTRLPPRSSFSMSDQHIVRRSANFQPAFWDNDYIQSLKSEYGGDSCIGRVNELKAKARMMLDKMMRPLDQLELIDILQRLGLSYHFVDEIKRILKTISSTSSNVTGKRVDLYATALEFRLLRQHGFDIPQDIFNCFLNEKGSFKSCLCEDAKGMLSLYEASYLLVEGESMLEVARDFSTKHLQEYVSHSKDEDFTTLVSHALNLPLHWRMLRQETRWFIDIYERRKDKNVVLLELAKLDFNMVQATYQEDLKHVSWWWRNTGIGEKLSFARDRLMMNFLYTVGEVFEPQFGYYRRMSTKHNVFITIIDDVYDVYGTLEELELFTDAVVRWDVNAMHHLPDYMKICFLALYNSINEMAFDALKEHGVHILPYLSKAWADLCKSYLLEARWYHSGYKPTLQEYMDNGWISISGPLKLMHAYFLVSNTITHEALECLQDYPNIIRWSSMICRLADDLGTSSDELKRGDVSKSIQCYMYETGASEEEAREHIRYLISEMWKKVNKDGVAADSAFSETFIGSAMNLVRTAQFMYQYGDGFGIQDHETKDRVLSLIVQPVPIAF